MLEQISERVGWRLKALRMTSDLTSFRRMALMGRTDPSIAEVDVRLRLLDGAAVAVRPHTADLWTLLDLIPPAHLPPPLDPPPRLIWDLGANIGLSMAHMAVKYPAAKIVGVELDAPNAELCRRNVAPWGDRCEVIQAGVWTEHKQISYAHQEGLEVAYRIDGAHLPDAATDRTAPSLLLNDLLERYDDDQMVDFVKMDIEGAESEVLREKNEWLSRVRSIAVEVHPPYTVEECHKDLGAWGFRTSMDPATWREGGGRPVFGVRPGS